MAEAFEEFVAKQTAKGAEKIHAAVFLASDKNGDPMFYPPSGSVLRYYRKAILFEIGRIQEFGRGCSSSRTR